MNVLLSRDCDGCSQIKKCKVRYRKVQLGEKVYCPDGTSHLVDDSSVEFGIICLDACKVKC